MLVTDRFVYIHQPKTGGTFVTTMLMQAHEARGDVVETVWIEPDAVAALPDVGPGRLLRVMMTTRNQHGARRDIPPPYRDRPVVATVRNPYDRYVSQFEFAWWREYPMFGPAEEVRRSYPHYPDLTFDDFVTLTNAVSVPYRPPGHPERTPGFHTQQFVEYFCREPETAYPKLDAGAAALDTWREELAGVRFLDQDGLNDGLHAFLVEMGYDAALVAFIRHAGRVMPGRGRTADQPWQAYYPPALKAFVRRKEDLLFRLFPQFDR